MFTNFVFCTLNHSQMKKKERRWSPITTPSKKLLSYTVPPMDADQRTIIRIQRYTKQLTTGCYNKSCTNPYCVNSKDFKKLDGDAVQGKVLELVYLFYPQSITVLLCSFVLSFSIQLESNNFCPLQNWLPEYMTLTTLNVLSFVPSILCTRFISNLF